MQPFWTVRLLGELTAEGRSQTVQRFSTQKTAALFAYLALYSDQAHSREELVDLLWPEDPPSATRNRLNQAISSLRRQFEDPTVDLGPVFFSDRHTIRINPDLLTTDVQAFETARAAAEKRLPSHSRFRRLHDAVSQYTGDLLPGLYEDWVLRDRQKLQGAFLQTLSTAVTTALASLRDSRPDAQVIADSLPLARRLVTLEPDVEEHHLHLIRLTAHTGDLSAAERCYREMERTLRRETGEEPTVSLSHLLRSLPPSPVAIPLPGVSSWRTGEETKEQTPPPQRCLLPARLSRMFGRESELQTAMRLLTDDECRLLTICGAGGCGKTTLSVKIAQQIAESEGWDCCFVPLAGVAAAEQVPDAILYSLRAQKQTLSQSFDRVVDELLRWRCPLLILDNFEQLVEGWSLLVGRLLDAVPGLRCIVTSRRRLNLDGEKEIKVGPLPLPESVESVPDLLSYPSVQLFVDRAQAVRPDFQVTPRNAETIRRLCERLEGIPLAIELAAAWAHTLTPAQMLEGLAHRFTLLVSRRRDISPRHRTLWATVEYSYRLLPTELQSFFTGLAVLEGGWTLEAATAVCGEPGALAYLEQLIENSLVVAEAGGSESRPIMRYRMLETIREYAWQQLTGDQRAVQSGRHAEYYTQLASEISAEGNRLPQSDALDRMDQERRNFTAALAWCDATEQATIGLRLASRLTPFWEIRGPLAEGRQWLQRLLALPQDDATPKEVADALSALGRIAWHQSDYAAAAAAHEHCLRLQKEMGDAQGTARSLYDLGILEIRRCHYDRAKEYLEDSLAIASTRGDPPGIARALLNLGNIARYHGRLGDAQTYFEQSLALERSQGNQERAALVQNNLAVLAIQEERYSVAEYYLQQALETFTLVRSTSGSGLAHLNRGKIAVRQGRYAEAVALFQESTRAHAEVGNRFFLIEATMELSSIAFQRDLAYPAAVGAAAAGRLLREIQAGLPPGDADLLTSLLSDTLNRLSPDMRTVALLQASALTEETAVAYLLESLGQ